MELILILNDFFLVVDGSETAPRTTTPKAIASQVHWKQKDFKACAIIMLHCREKQLVQLKHSKLLKLFRIN